MSLVLGDRTVGILDTDMNWSSFISTQEVRQDHLR